ncbi:hypothetical protein TNCT_674091 [Trichonephila clavata]|uniref:Uncharacterized protein n=1 Tax=Trichonephila clavata TaxID=2740835 RepID=A0A8X6FWK6_TRICU|nr:hypothetical protein TNCT_674091 [Trichonephila clavata]
MEVKGQVCPSVAFKMVPINACYDAMKKMVQQRECIVFERMQPNQIPSMCVCASTLRLVSIEGTINHFYRVVIVCSGWLRYFHTNQDHYQC